MSAGDRVSDFPVKSNIESESQFRTTYLVIDTGLLLLRLFSLFGRHGDGWVCQGQKNVKDAPGGRKGGGRGKENNADATRKNVEAGSSQKKKGIGAGGGDCRKILHKFEGCERMWRHQIFN